MSYEDPPIAERLAAVPTENGYLEMGRGPDGSRRYKVYVAQSAEQFDADEADIALLRRIGHEGRLLAEVIEAPGVPTDVRERLAAFIDKGFIEAPERVPSATAKG